MATHYTLLAALSLSLSSLAHAAWEADAARDTFMARSDRVYNEDYSATLNILFDASDGCQPILALLTNTPGTATTKAPLRTVAMPLIMSVDDKRIIRWPTTRVLDDGKLVILGNDLTADALIALAQGTYVTVTFTDDPDAIARFSLAGSQAAISEAFASCVHARSAQPQVVIP